MVQYLDFMLYLVIFYDALILLLLPSSVQYIGGTDGGTARFATYLSAAFITVFVLATSGFKKLPSVYLGALMVFIVFSSLHGPNIHFEGVFTPKDAGLYNFKPLFECFLYF